MLDDIRWPERLPIFARLIPDGEGPPKHVASKISTFIMLCSVGNF